MSLRWRSRITTATARFQVLTLQTKWVVEGYQTMLDECDGQVLASTGGARATHAIVPVGCGSIAQAVTQHLKSAGREQPVTVVAVEPQSAPCLNVSLAKGEMMSVPTSDSIMNGMNCGTLSTTAWPVLRAGVDASVVVTEMEAHRAAQELATTHGIGAGPCGAAALAALRRVCEVGREQLGLDGMSVVVLFCTEGSREYDAPV